MLTAAQQKDKSTLAEAWQNIAKLIAREDAERTEVQRDNSRRSPIFAGRPGPTGRWAARGCAARPRRSGDFAWPSMAIRLCTPILPAGAYTHVLSDKLNGTLRSPVLTTNKKKISFQVLGQHSSAVRLVSNNCQLNYAQLRYLTSAEPQWITFTCRHDADDLRIYAELMTMFDNPKFPDQLGSARRRQEGPPHPLGAGGRQSALVLRRHPRGAAR